MQQLSQQDAMFVHSESARAPMHLSSVHLYDPTTAPDGTVTFDQFVEHVASLLPLARVLRRKLIRVPFDLDHPYWVEDKDFDLRFHVRRAALPEPGDRQTLWELAARHHAQPLDLERPPWELYFIEGVGSIDGRPGGGFAMQIKIHHSAIDGISGIELMNALHALDPNGRDPVDDPWEGEDPPSGAKLLARTAQHAAFAPKRMLAVLGRTLPLLQPSAARRATLAGATALTTARPPDTVLNRRVTTNRVGDAMVIDLADAKAVRRAVDGATVNDVLLAVVGGGLRRYLCDIDALPDTSLIAGVPISLRTEADTGTAGNKLAMMLVPLATDIADGPRARLEAIRDATARSKEQSQAVEARVLAESAELFPGAMLGLAVRANAAQGPSGTTARIGNVCVTNVPGSQVPLYLLGARMEAYYSLGPVYDNAGPIHLVVSYLGRIFLSVTTCREIVPDIGHYVDCLRAEWDDLLALTDQEPGA
jgi:WS/DGAT/MGAT family acyltransferase